MSRLVVEIRLIWKFTNYPCDKEINLVIFEVNDDLIVIIFCKCFVIDITDNLPWNLNFLVGSIHIAENSTIASSVSALYGIANPYYRRESQAKALHFKPDSSLISLLFQLLNCPWLHPRGILLVSDLLAHRTRPCLFPLSYFIQNSSVQSFSRGKVIDRPELWIYNNNSDDPIV